MDGPLDVTAITDALGSSAGRDGATGDRSHRRRPRSPAHGVPLPSLGVGPDVTTLSVGALAPAFVAVSVGAPLTFLLMLLAQEHLPGKPVGEAAAFLVLWTCAALASGWATRRYGSGDLSADTRFAVRPIDGLGAVFVALVIVQLHELVIRAVAANTVGGLGPRSGFLTPPHVQPDHLIAVTLLITAVIGPLVEEVFFRGIVQGALSSRFHPAIAITAQAVVAGACHANPGLGYHTLSVVLASVAAALVLGIARHWSGRLGPGLLGHSLYQVLVVLAVLRGA